MTIDQVLQELQVIQSRLHALLDDDGRRGLVRAIEEIRQQKTRGTMTSGKRKKRKQLEARRWRLVIPPAMPIRFIPTGATQDLRHRLSLDIFCSIEGPFKEAERNEHNIAIRVWTDDSSLYFRHAYDSLQIRDDVAERGGRRVMLRFHFDCANPDQPGPKYHLQIGGLQHANEFCWFPENIRVPRFCHHPLSLVMACEFVVKTFYPDAYHDLSKEATWRGAIATAQETYLPAYYARQGTTPTSLDMTRHSLLNRLWNVAAS